MRKTKKTSISFVLLWLSMFSVGSPVVVFGGDTESLVAGKRSDGQIAIFELPFVIEQSGHYFLSRTLTGVSGANGVTIDSDDVTLDLNGFSLIGVPGSLAGISATSFLENVTILNGSVRDWGGTGVQAGVNNGKFSELQIYRNGGDGLNTGSNCSLSNILSFSNGGRGILVSVGCVATHIVARGNQGPGILADTGAKVSDCTSVLNLGGGISAGGGVLISGCTSRGNFGDGILVDSDCMVINNNSTRGTVGIHVTGAGNRIEGNNVTDNFTSGVLVDVGGNFIVKNTARGNGTSFDLAAGNTVGRIVTGPTSAIQANAWANFEF